jgi:hypothetical protein
VRKRAGDSNQPQHQVQLRQKIGAPLPHPPPQQSV